jgi:hypothetical protein
MLALLANRCIELLAQLCLAVPVVLVQWQLAQTIVADFGHVPVLYDSRLYRV